MLDIADFALQEQPEDNLMVAISRAWYNGSYTMAAEPIKTLELHYSMIQFLIFSFIRSRCWGRHRLCEPHSIPEEKIWFAAVKDFFHFQKLN